MVNKICFITPYHMQPPAPRVLMEMEILKKENFIVDMLFPPKELGIHQRNLYLKNEFNKIKNNYDKFIIYDLLSLVYLSPIIKQVGKEKIIYEVLDSFPHYYSYKIFKRNFLDKFAVFCLDKLEEFYIKQYTNAVLVNSNSLFNRLTKYSKNVNTLLYSSPFENKTFYNNPNLVPAFLYIGLFNKEKGAEEIISLASKNKNINFYIIGDIKIDIKEKLNNIIFYNRVESNKLFSILKKISQKNFLFGLSLIKSINKSYAMQEANKDIDYLALGIPIIGNKRLATYEKIQKGAGLLIDDKNLLEKIFDRSLKEKLSLKAKELYKLYYSFDNFKRTLINVCK